MKTVVNASLLTLAVWMLLMLVGCSADHGRPADTAAGRAQIQAEANLARAVALTK